MFRVHGSKILALLACMMAMPAIAQEPPQSSIYRDRDGNYQGAIATFCLPAKDGSGCASGSGSSTVAAQGTDGTTARTLRTDGRGGLVPAQGIANTTRTTLVASTATSISAAATGRIGLTVQVEAALTANLFLCTTQTTACSATSYDALIPSGAGAGTTYTFLFAPSTALYAFTTGTPTLVANSWTAP